MVFRQSYIDSYLHLTLNPGSKFTTIPSAFTQPVNKNDSTISFALDFSSLLLFYFLEKEHNFKFIHTFSVSFYLKDKIDKEIYELENSPSSPMTIQITTEYIRKFETPENYNQKRIEFLNSLLEWIDKNCVIDLIPEKLNVLPKLSENERFNGIMKDLVDYMCLNDRKNCRIISSDTTLFSFTRKNNMKPNIINPEKYLIQFYPELCGTDFYHYLLKSNYLGINITLDTLKNEFFQYVSGGQSRYNLCLENITYNVHLNPQIIFTLSKFLKELYIMQSLTIEKKNRYAAGVLTRAIYGMPKEVVIQFSRQIYTEFQLMGDLYDQIMSVFTGILE